MLESSCPDIIGFWYYTLVVRENNDGTIQREDNARENYNKIINLHISVRETSHSSVQ